MILGDNGRPVIEQPDCLSQVIDKACAEIDSTFVELLEFFQSDENESFGAYLKRIGGLPQ